MKKRLLLILIALLCALPIYADSLYSGTVSAGETLTIDGEEFAVTYSDSKGLGVIKGPDGIYILGPSECKSGQKYRHCITAIDTGVIPTELSISISEIGASISISRNIETTSPNIGEKVDIVAKLENTGEIGTNMEYIDEFPADVNLDVAETFRSGNVVRYSGQLNPGVEMEIKYSITLNKVMEFESSAKATYTVNGKKTTAKDTKTIKTSRPYSINQDFTKTSVAQDEAINYTLSLENEADSRLGINSFKITFPSDITIIEKSSNLKSDGNILSFDEDLDEGHEELFLIVFSSSKKGKYDITTELDATYNGVDFKEKLEDEIRVGMSRIVPKISFDPEIVKSGLFFEVEITMKNEGTEQIDDVSYILKSELFGEDIAEKVDFEPGRERLIFKNRLKAPLEAKEYPVSIEGSYNDAAGKLFTFEDQASVTVEAFKKPLKLDVKVEPLEVERGKAVTVEVSVENIGNSQLEASLIDTPAKSVLKYVEGERFKDIVIAPQGKETAYTYTINVPEDFPDEKFNLNSVLNYEVEGDFLTEEKETEVTVLGEAPVIDEADDEPEEDDTEVNQTSDDTKDPEEVDDVGFFGKILNWFMSLFS